MKAIGYIRVSSEKQVESGISLGAQEAKVRGLAMVHEWTLAEVIEDAGESASSLNRPGMNRLMGMVARREVDVVIIAKLDRITRSVRDLAHLLETFEKYGVALVSVADSLNTGTASGRLVLNIMTAVSQWEREAIGERTRAAMEHKRSRGERVGTIPYGFCLLHDGTHLVPCQPEQEVLGIMTAHHVSGLSCSDVAAKLNVAGYRTRRGDKWDRRYVAKLLARGKGKENGR
jgi:DNA invertase Pin-like site-specific DNA recombinase